MSSGRAVQGASLGGRGGPALAWEVRVRIRCFLATVSLLLPAAAFAQTITSSFQATSASGVVSVNIGKTLCLPNRQIDFRVDYTPTGTPPASGTDTVAFFITADASTCSDSSKDPPGTAKNVGSAQLDQFVINTSYLVSELVAGLPNGCNDATKSAASPFTVFFCVRRKTNSLTGGQTLLANSLPVNFALIPPKAPTLSADVTPGDGHLRFSWTSNDPGDSSYDAFVVPPGKTVDSVPPAATVVQQTSVDVSSASGGGALQNGTVYALYVQSIDAYANVSALSNS